MLTVPDSFWAELMRPSGPSGANRRSRHHVVYELALDAGTLYYSSSDLTFGGNPYTGLALKASGHREELRKIKASLRVTFGNVTNTLRSQIEPTDLISGRTMTARLLMRDDAAALLADSLVLFAGTMERPRRIGEKELELLIVDPINGPDVELPRRRTAPYCPWLFANGDAFDGAGHCQYVSSTTTTNSGSSSTGPINLTAASNFADGDAIRVGAAGATKVSIVSGGGTTALTVSDPISWSISDPVRFAECNREIDNCVARGEARRFGGVPTVLSISRLVYARRNFREPLPV